jgi:hypothetical protein
MRTTEFLKVLMDDNHRHKKDVTSLVNRWITSRIFRNMQSTKGMREMLYICCTVYVTNF